MIGKEAFKNCGNLVKVILPEWLNIIEFDAFHGCENLKNIRFPDKLEEIGARCFKRTGLEELIFPVSVKNIAA